MKPCDADTRTESVSSHEIVYGDSRRLDLRPRGKAKRGERKASFVRRSSTGEHGGEPVSVSPESAARSPWNLRTPRPLSPPARCRTGSLLGSLSFPARCRTSGISGAPSRSRSLRSLSHRWRDVPVSSRPRSNCAQFAPVPSPFHRLSGFPSTSHRNGDAHFARLDRFHPSRSAHG